MTIRPITNLNTTKNISFNAKQNKVTTAIENVIQANQNVKKSKAPAIFTLSLVPLAISSALYLKSAAADPLTNQNSNYTTTQNYPSALAMYEMKSILSNLKILPKKANYVQKLFYYDEMEKELNFWELDKKKTNKNVLVYNCKQIRMQENGEPLLQESNIIIEKNKNGIIIKNDKLKGYSSILRDKEKVFMADFLEDGSSISVPKSLVGRKSLHAANAVAIDGAYRDSYSDVMVNYKTALDILTIYENDNKVKITEEIIQKLGLEKDRENLTQQYNQIKDDMNNVQNNNNEEYFEIDNAIN